MRLVNGDPMNASNGISIEAILMEVSTIERFPEGECALCGSLNHAENILVRSKRISEPVMISICMDCREEMEGAEVEQFFRSTMERNTYTWSKIVAHNFRKLNWISRLAFDIMNETKSI